MVIIMRKKWRYVKNPQFSGSVLVLTLAGIVMLFKAIWIILPFILFALFTIIVIFIITHFRALNDDEVNNLALKRRNKDIQAYYSFCNYEIQVDKEFKKSMKPDGKFYKINESLRNFPSIAAALLKYKKHEWIILAFEKDQIIDLVWVNKGLDNASAAMSFPLQDIANFASDHNYISILMFHNHPNDDPRRYTYASPSDADISLAKNFSYRLDWKSINHLAFVCESGMYYKYFMSIADSFYPIKEYLKTINDENGSSIAKNLSLHIERLL